MKLHKIKLQKKDKEKLISIISSGANRARVIRRAQILLKSNEGLIDKEIKDHLGCAINTICTIRRLYCAEGLDRAIYDAPRSGPPRSFTNKQDTQIVALACTTPPEGHSTWTLELICEKAKDKKFVKSVSRKKVWTLLKEHNLKPWQKKTLCSKVG